jgi:hypothetical protein
VRRLVLVARAATAAPASPVKDRAA